MKMLKSLTLGEVAKIEDLSGQPIQSFGDDHAPMGKAMAAFAYVVKRRQDPTFTWEDALGLSLEEAQGLLGGVDDDVVEAEIGEGPTNAPE